MKKILVLVAAAMMAVVNVNAQEDYESMKHEIAVSYGALSNSTWMAIGDDIGTSFITLGNVRYDDGKFFGPLALEYFYHLDPLVGIGAIGLYAQEKKDLFIKNDIIGEAKNTYLTILPAAKFNWLRKKYFGLYSKVGAGISFRSQKEDYKSSDHDDVSKSDVFFSWQVSAIGIEAGSANIRAFTEFGIGEQGMALGGIRVKF